MAYKEQQPKPLGEVGSKTTYTVKSGNKKELVKEHKRLVHVLRSPSREDDKEEAKLQAKELEEMEEGKDYKPAIKKSLDRANDLIKAMKEDAEEKEDSLSEEEMDLKKKFKSKKQQKYMYAAAERGDVPKKVVEEFSEKTSKKDYKKMPEKVAKALKAAAIIGLTRRQRMDTAYRLGVAEGMQAQKTPFATEDLSDTPIKIGITEDQVRPSYEPPVVPVRKVNNNPGYIAPKPCGDHEYKTSQVGSEEAKPIKDR